MISYFFGFIYVIFSIIIYQIIGTIFTKSKLYSYRFTIGFIIHSFLVAILGMAIQVINLPWKIFFYGMIFLFVFEILLIIYCIKQRKIEINMDIIKEYIKSNWFLYIGMIMLTVFSLFHIAQLWSNNYTDDGHYISLMSSLPYTENAFRIDPVSGFKSGFSLERIINTFELEASFFIYLLKIPGTLYARVFLSMLNHFIGLNVINAFFSKLSNKDEGIHQYFSTCAYFLIVNNIAAILNTGAAWSIITAPYYGSSLVKVISPFVLILPILKINKLNIYNILIVFMSCVVLVSKSSCAIPIIFLMAVGYLISYDFCGKKWFIFLIPLIAIIGILVGNNSYLENYIISIFYNYRMPIVLVIILSVICLKMIMKPLESKRIIIILVTSLLLTFVPYLNNVYEKLTIYDFVSERTWLSLWLFAILIGVYYMVEFLYDLLLKYANKIIKIGALVAIVISCGAGSLLIGKNEYGGIHIRTSVQTYKLNKYIVPQSTVDLSEQLNKYYNENKKILKVIIDPGIICNGYTHYTAAILRSFAPNIQSIVGALRINPEIKDKESEFNNFNLDDLAVFNSFEVNPTKKNLNELKKLNEEYPFDCLIIVNANEIHNELLATIDYRLYGLVEDTQNKFTYGIYIKNIDN